MYLVGEKFLISTTQLQKAILEQKHALTDHA